MEQWTEQLQSKNLLEGYRAEKFIEYTDGAEPLTEMDTDFMLKILNISRSLRMDHCWWCSWTERRLNVKMKRSNNCKGILYSNASFRGIYDIGHVKIEAAESLGNVDPYIVMYDNQLQKSHSGFELVKVGDEEILRQLKNILSFALDAVFDEDKSTVERICRKKESGRGKYPVPSEFINGTLDISKNVSDDEMKSCGVFLEQLLALNREDYINILNCIYSFNIIKFI